MRSGMDKCGPMRVVALAVVCAATFAACDLFRQDGVDTDETVTFDGVTRYFSVHLPPGYDGKTALPLLVVLHGAYQTIDDIKFITGFDDLADDRNFFALYPQAYEDQWNDGRAVAGIPAYDLGIDDVAFVCAVMDRVLGSYHIDPGRVYVAGMSNGAMMAHRLAMAEPERFAAMAAVAGTMPQNLTTMYDPALPVPVLLMHGTEDPIVPYEGGVLNPSLPMGVVLSAPQSAAFWAENNDCATTPESVLEPNAELTNETTVYRNTYPPQTGAAEVVFYRIEGGGHSWPGSPWLLSLTTAGRISGDIDASQVIWDFCARHTRSPE